MEFSQEQHYSPQTPAQASVSRVMLNVILALIPGIAVYIYYFGWGVLVNIVLASLFALLAEGLVLAIRKRPVFTTLLDGSALLTAIHKPEVGYETQARRGVSLDPMPQGAFSTAHTRYC